MQFGKKIYLSITHDKDIYSLHFQQPFVIKVDSAGNILHPFLSENIATAPLKTRQAAPGFW
jgi:hypothetical protein